jgi:ribosome recycling factor
VSETDPKALQRRMDGALDVLKKEFGGLRTGRASAAILDPVQVDAYGSHVPLNQVAGVSVPEPRLIVVQVWDRGVVKAVDKAIRESGIGLNPQTEGQTIRLPIPELTQDRRKELSKLAHKYAEAAKVSVRNVRRDGMEALKKSEKKGDITEDEHRRMSQEVQQKTDDHVKKIDEMLAQKEKEILNV